MARRDPRDPVEMASGPGAGLKATAPLPFDMEDEVTPAAAPSAPAPRSGPSLAEEKRTVVVATGEKHPPAPRYRVLKKFKTYHRGHPIEMAVGYEFDESHHGKPLVERFISDGLEVEAIG